MEEIVEAVGRGCCGVVGGSDLSSWFFFFGSRAELLDPRWDKSVVVVRTRHGVVRPWRWKIGGGLLKQEQRSRWWWWLSVMVEMV
ncbi:hypothetical protein ACLB2K_025644 [Fragaria x ananassa]